MTPYKIAVAVQNDSSCHQAVRWAVDLCGQLSATAANHNQPSYKLYFIYAVAQDPPSKIPVLDRMDRGLNLEIHEEAKQDVVELLQYLDTVTEPLAVEYEFVKLERESTTIEQLLLEFTQTHRPQVFVVGSHRQGQFKKFILGSVSQYCVDHLPCPVVVIKS